MFLSYDRTFLRLLEPLTHASFSRELITFHGGLLKTQQGLPGRAPGWIVLSNLLYFTRLSTHVCAAATPWHFEGLYPLAHVHS